MTLTRSKSQILKAVNHPHLDMHYASGQEGGYWYFIYDDGGKIYETHSIFVMRLNWMELERWVSDAKEFIKSVEERFANNG